MGSHMKNLIYLILLCAINIGSLGCTTFRASGKTLNEVSYGHDIVRREASTSTYRIRGECNGLPRIDVQTAPGFCLGLVDNGEGLVKPRYALQVDETHLLVTEMGGWKPYHGQIYLLTKENNKWKRSAFLNSTNVTGAAKCILDRTQQLLRGPDNEIYVTSAVCIAKVSPNAANPNDQLKVLISNLPTDGLHASKSIAFDSQANIYLNVGSFNDNCELEVTDVCNDLQGLNGRGVIRKYVHQADGTYNLNYSIFAKGQRNSLALYWDNKSSTLWTGENARDYIERKDSQINGDENPSDEFNVIHENDELDWPYCYNNGVSSPEFPRADCSHFVKPVLLLPAHAAPLSFLMYTGTLFPTWYQNRLLMSFHGYAPYGHRIVTYKRTVDMQPTGDPLSLVYGWNAKGSQLTGSPVGLSQGLDGSVFIVEDNSQKILQLYYNAKEGDGTPVAELKVGHGHEDNSQLAQEFKRAEEKRKIAFDAKMARAEIPLFTQIQSKVIDQNCTMCHGGLNYPGIQILKYDDIGNYKKLKLQLWARLNGAGVPQMPPSGLLPEHKSAVLALVKQWMDAGSPAP
jgi:glucose/arabinose dehydrogenase